MMEIYFDGGVRFMMQSDKVKRALEAVGEACGHCEICSPDCPVAISKRALSGLLYDLKQMEGTATDSECP